MSLGLHRTELQLQDAIPKLVSRRNVLNFRKNEVIFSQGDPADAVFYLQTGRVKIAVVSPSGKEATLSMFGAKELVGLGCLSVEKRRLGTATALEQSELIRIDRTSWINLLREQPELFEVGPVPSIEPKHRTSERPVRSNS